ncbi:50S ribosomal protein L3 [Candidatus Woesearchaeota archaeon]|nr:50S ribosomal protein L3 [Candidatus Woesearchaeota archaeon]
MGKRLQPRHGSMGVWPRKRAKRSTARVRGWTTDKKVKGLLAFPVYKAGMTHVMTIDTRKNNPTKGETLTLPSTVLECPPIKLYSVRFYKQDSYGSKVVKEFVVGKDKHLFRRLFTKKTTEAGLKDIKPEEYSDITVTVMTQPSKTGIGKKKPEIVESKIGGSTEEQLAWVNEHVGKEIRVNEVFQEGEYVDSHAITKGKGFQGSVRRFGIGLKASKSEKGRRTPGSLGGWTSQQHVMYRVAHAGQTGYHQRTQYNNIILKYGEDPKEVNPSAGFKHFGLVKNDYLLIQGSLQGAAKRMITLTKAVRLYDVRKKPLPTVELVAHVRGESA